MSNIQFTLTQAENGQRFVTVFANGTLSAPAPDDHPNFKAIVAACQAAFDGDDSISGDDVLALFDVRKLIERKFERLGERVSVEGDTVLFDGDPVDGTLQDQILAFLDAGEDFEPLVKFWEKLTTNPLGDVRQGLYDWINGQRKNGNFTITAEGDVLGYKSVREQAPEWREGYDTVFVPSRRGIGRVNDTEVSAGRYIEQVPGDIVEMPRSKVLNAPSAACGDGLHIGTYQYASTFHSGGCNTVMLVKFSPRDIVSLPDSNATWKLRVCRYEVVGQVTEPLEVPVYAPVGQEQPEVEYGHGDSDLDFDLGFEDDEDGYYDSNDDIIHVGDRVEDCDGDEGVVERLDDDGVTIRYDDRTFGSLSYSPDEVTIL